LVGVDEGRKARDDEGSYKVVAPFYISRKAAEANRTKEKWEARSTVD